MASTDIGSTDTSDQAAAGSVPRARDGRRHERRPPPTGWLGWILFAGYLMIVVGMFQATWGLIALLRSTFYVVGSQGMAVNLDLTVWGWIQLAVGALMLIVGVGLLMAKTWARVAALVLVALSALANFLTLSASPIWSVIMLAIDVIVIYALAVHGDELNTVQQ